MHCAANHAVWIQIKRLPTKQNQTTTTYRIENVMHIMRSVCDVNAPSFHTHAYTKACIYAICPILTIRNQPELVVSLRVRWLATTCSSSPTLWRQHTSLYHRNDNNEKQRRRLNRGKPPKLTPPLPNRQNTKPKDKRQKWKEWFETEVIYWNWSREN